MHTLYSELLVNKNQCCESQQLPYLTTLCICFVVELCFPDSLQHLPLGIKYFSLVARLSQSPHPGNSVVGQLEVMCSMKSSTNLLAMWILDSDPVANSEDKTCEFFGCVFFVSLGVTFFLWTENCRQGPACCFRFLLLVVVAVVVAAAVFLLLLVDGLVWNCLYNLPYIMFSVISTYFATKHAAIVLNNFYSYGQECQCEPFLTINLLVDQVFAWNASSDSPCASTTRTLYPRWLWICW